MPALAEPRRVALFCDRKDGHARLIEQALARRGVEAIAASLSACGVDTTAPLGLRIPGFEAAPPLAAFVRGVPAGTFEQVTQRLTVLHALRECGVVVWNDARAIEACIDKSMTSWLMARAGLPTPPTFTAQSRAAAVAILEAHGAPMVLKPLFGSQGRGVRLVSGAADLPQENEPGVAGVYYLQRFVEPENAVWRDYRVFVVAGRALAGMTRVGATWVTNIRQGAAAQPLVISEEMRAAAETAARATGADYAGVDLIRGRSGVIEALEVNSMPAWTGLQQVNPQIDIAQAVADAFLLAVARRSDAAPRAVS
ncbi:MAG: RimK family alpha-L-glutamate ligase [Hyphomicrobiales bacterium]|nr:RimK family alpha-L-glutamate ligase [Hyphomicrobiales bacterium]